MNADRLTERFFRYVRCASESGNEAAFCSLIEDELLALGLEVFRDEVGQRCGSNGWNVIARLPGNGESLLLSAHLDTVCPGVGIEPVFEGATIRSSGNTVLGADDKAGVAAIMEALQTVLEQDLPHRTIEILFSVCEEPGLFGAKFADFSRITARQAVVLDSEHLGEVVHRNPANMFLSFLIEGKAAHAGFAPEQGIHALKAAARAVSRISVGRVDDVSIMNISNFLSPGKTNIVADKASFDMEIRSLEEESLQRHIHATQQTVREACEEFGAKYSMESERRSDVIYVHEDAPLMCELRRVYDAVGLDCVPSVSFGGCDATHIYAAGIEVLNLGIGMQAAHSCEETIACEDLKTTSRIVQLLMSGKYARKE